MKYHWGYRRGEETRANILDAIKELTAELGIPPSRRELARRVGKGKTTVHYHIKVLEERGLVTRIPNTARSVTLESSRPQTEG